jgi:hypothetical protein
MVLVSLCSPGVPVGYFSCNASVQAQVQVQVANVSDYYSRGGLTALTAK